MNAYEVLSFTKPKELPHPPRSLDYADHVVKTALLGHTQLAADSLLNPALVGKLAEVVGSITRRLNLIFARARWVEDCDESTILKRGYAYDLLLEIAINLFGMEADWVGFTEEDVEDSLRIIRNTLSAWESIERRRGGEASIAEAVVRLKIEDMKLVMAKDPRGRRGMIAVMGESVEKKLDHNNVMLSFLEAIKEEIQTNVYYVMSKRRMCRFGNDYAVGLRWLRRLGFVQVSTNPVLAAIAYRDDPRLWGKLRDHLRKHPEHLKNIDQRQDELAMVATMLALWPNMEVFRPVAHLKRFSDGMVSYQLNPNVANSLEGSLKDALRIYRATQEYFSGYDEYLLWGWTGEVERGRPNIVFKVAGSSPAAIDITAELESLGIGTNNTITYTVSQEATLILAKMRGMAKAARMGIRTTKVYETNMGGRLEGHLREVKAAQLIREALAKFSDPEGRLLELAKKLGVPGVCKGKPWKAPTGWGYEYEAKTLDEKITLVSFRQYLRPLTKEPLAGLLTEAGMFSSKKEAMKHLKEWEESIGLAGTLVTQRVWWLFFSPENRPKWLAYLISELGLTAEKAEEVLGNIDVLPASKRKPMDTYLTLARWNMTNTEFPNHQQSVLEESRKPGFNLTDYDNAVTKRHDPRIVEKLAQLEDFIKAYELTPELARLMKRVGVDVEGFGLRGLPPEEWGEFGSTVKTMTGFTEAYNRFRDDVVKLAKEVAEELGVN